MKTVRTCAKVSGKRKDCYCVLPLSCQRKDRDHCCKSTSRDSGVDGLKDSPEASSNSDGDLSEYIVDPITLTTYVKGAFLGKGGFARVHEVTDLTSGVVYAGKIISKSRITKLHHSEKISREIELHSGLKHRNVVRFHRYFEDSKNIYIILENCPKKSLFHVLHNRRSLTEPEVRYYLRQLVEGVRYVHSEQIVHRDLKLGNMFLSQDMVTKVGDFGLASRVNGNLAVTICGTPNYIAPEVLNQQGHGFEADIWAIGCIMYAMLVGQPPFETSTLNETYYRITNNKYILPPSVSDAAKSLIRALLHPLPDQRPSLDEVLHHEFFASGYVFLSLCPSSCYRSPFSTDDDPSLSSSSSSCCTKVPKHAEKPCKITQITSSVSMLKVTKNKASDLGKLQNGASPRKKNAWTRDLEAAHRLIVRCLEAIPREGASDAPAPRLTMAPLFVTKWIDYSNKFGFGFQLSDKAVGVVFNNRSKMIFDPRRSYLQYQDASGNCSVHSVALVPQAILGHYELLRFVAQYMDENLAEGARDVPGRSGASSPPEQSVQVKHWVRIPSAIVMQLTNGSFQVNFHNHSKVIFSAHGAHGSLVTFVGCDRVITTHRMTAVVEHGCDQTVLEGMRQASDVLRNLLEQEEVDR